MNSSLQRSCSRRWSYASARLLLPDFLALRLALVSDFAPIPRLNPLADAGAPRAPKLGAVRVVAPPQSPTPSLTPNEKAPAVAADGAWAVAPNTNAPTDGSAVCWPNKNVFVATAGRGRAVLVQISGTQAVISSGVARSILNRQSVYPTSFSSRWALVVQKMCRGSKPFLFRDKSAGGCCAIK